MNTDVLMFSVGFVVASSLAAMAFSRIPGKTLPYTDISTPMPPVKPPKNRGPNVPEPEKPTPRTKDQQNWA